MAAVSELVEFVSASHVLMRADVNVWSFRSATLSASPVMPHIPSSEELYASIGRGYSQVRELNTKLVARSRDSGKSKDPPIDSSGSQRGSVMALSAPSHGTKTL